LAWTNLLRDRIEACSVTRTRSAHTLSARLGVGSPLLGVRRRRPLPAAVRLPRPLRLVEQRLDEGAIDVERPQLDADLAGRLLERLLDRLGARLLGAGGGAAQVLNSASELSSSASTRPIMCSTAGAWLNIASQVPISRSSISLASSVSRSGVSSAVPVMSRKYAIRVDSGDSRRRPGARIPPTCWRGRMRAWWTSS
jgi:hypothetical protein